MVLVGPIRRGGRGDDARQQVDRCSRVNLTLGTIFNVMVAQMCDCALPLPQWRNLSAVRNLSRWSPQRVKCYIYYGALENETG